MLRAFPCHAIGQRPPDRQPFAQSFQHAYLQLVCGGELLNQVVADVTVFSIRLAVLREKFNIVRLQTLMIAEAAEEFSAG